MGNSARLAEGREASLKRARVNATEVHFPCPNCRQKLACEPGYGGWRIQCPACQGAVIVPLALPPPLPAVRPPPPAVVLSPADKWRRHGIRAVAAIGVALVSFWLAERYLDRRTLAVLGVPFWNTSLVAIMAVVIFLGGSWSVSRASNSLPGQLLGGVLLLLVPVLTTWLALEVVQMLGAGCMVILGKSAQGLKEFMASFVTFLVLAVVLSVMAGILNALRRR